MAGKIPDKAQIDLVPILVGIVGHRDIPEADQEGLELRIRSVFKTLRKKYPHTPVAAVTALAEGADTIGARAARAEGFPIIAPLPMPPEDYKKTFSTPEKAAELDTFLRNSLAHVCPSYRDTEDSMDHQFARAGAAVVQYSHLVIALWNGEESGMEAGTSFLIRHALKGIPKDIVFDLEGSKPSPLDPISTAMVRQIPVERKSKPGFKTEGAFPDAPDGKFAVIRFGRSEKADLTLTRIQRKTFEQFDEFNKVIIRHRPKDGSWARRYTTQNKTRKEPLTPQVAAKDLPEGLRVLRERFAMADYLSHHFQMKRHWRITRYVVILAALVAFTHQIIGSSLPLTEWLSPPQSWVDRLPGNGQFDYTENWPYIAYALLLAVAYGTVFYARYRRWQVRYLDYRTIAEGARIQFFWLIAGIRTPVVNYFLRKQRDELEWIRGVLRLWYLRAVVSDGVIEEATPEEAALIEDYWIRDQFEESSAKALRSNLIDRSLTCLAFAFLTILFLGMGAQPFLSDEELKQSIVLATAGAGSLILLVSSLRYFLGYREIHKSKSRMTVLFADADHFYDPTDGIQEEEREILGELGREALTETGDWLLSNRNRKVNLPKAP